MAALVMKSPATQLPAGSPATPSVPFFSDGENFTPASPQNPQNSVLFHSLFSLIFPDLTIPIHTPLPLKAFKVTEVK